MIRRTTFFVVSVFLCIGSIGCDKKNSNTERADKKIESQKQRQKQKKNVEDKSQKSDKSNKPKQEHKMKKDSPLLNPSKADAKAPSSFEVKFETTAGEFVAEFNREWAPNGVDRFYNLVKIGYFEDVAFFRVIEGFMAQFGIHGNPKVSKAWKGQTIEDDPVEKSNKRGFITFAQRRAPNTRNTQLFINFQKNSNLDKQGFAPIGKVTKGMETVNSIHAGYGEGAPRGDGPSQQKLKEKGNEYLKNNFPKLDYIKSTEIVSE